MPAPSDLSVICPGCGGSTVDHGPGHHPSRYHCVDRACPFTNGWRLELAAHHDALEELEGPSTVYATPAGGDGALDFEHAVIWPSVLTAWARAV